MTQATALPLDPGQLEIEPARPFATLGRSLRTILWVSLRLAIALLTVWLIVEGMRLRSAVWTQSESIHFHHDLGNTFEQGQAVIAEGQQLAGADAKQPLSWPQLFRGFVHRYDTVVSEGSDDARYGLDYAPGRLLVAAIWVRHVQATHPERSDLDEDVDALPLIAVNTACEGVSALFMFLLVRHWWRRRYPRRVSLHDNFFSEALPIIVSRQDQPWILGLLAAAVVWFNPALLLDGHAWPQWDVWLLPFFLGALWLASGGKWFVAGTLLAGATMFKGQLLMVTPALILWPLLGGRIVATLRLVIGALFAGALLTSPWLVGSGWLWVAGIVAATVALAMLHDRGDWTRAGVGGWIGAVMVALFIALPWTMAGALPNFAIAIPLLLAVLVTGWVVRWFGRRSMGTWVAIVTTLAIVAASSAFSGTWSWFDVGFRYPTYHFPVLAQGVSQNIPVLLEKVYHWHLYDTVWSVDLGKTHGSWDVSIKILLSAIFGITLLLCGFAAAIHAKRNDPRVLIALTAPWILMFTLLPQMHSRYLVWGAAAGAVGWAISVELALLNLLVSALATLLMLHSLIGDKGGDQSDYPIFFSWMRDAYPGLGWMMALIGAIYLYQAMPSLRRRLR